MTAWNELLGSRLGPLPDELQVQAGSQFAVHQDRVLAHPRAFYQECLTWLANSTELSPKDMGMVFEYVWKLILGEAAERLDLNLWEYSFSPAWYHMEAVGQRIILRPV